MPNPFKRQGDAFHQHDEWVAPGVGLIGALARAQAAGALGNIVLIGNIGLGKTAALRHYVRGVEGGVVLRYSLQDFSPEEALALRTPVFNDLIEILGDEAADGALKTLGLAGKGTGAPPRRDQIMSLIREMVSASSRAGKPVHLVVDECQLPAEMFERQASLPKVNEWFESLLGLAGAVRDGGGHVAIAITPSPWESQAPRKLRDRFTSIEATAPTPDEIQSFAEAGLAQAPDGPRSAHEGLGAALLENLLEIGDITVRTLHERLHAAWERACRGASAELTAAHLADA